MVGQLAASLSLSRMVEKGNIPNGLLFSGVRGSGKTTAGRILAAALNCPDRTSASPCGVCKSCDSIFSGKSLDVHEIDAASQGNVASVRALLDMLQYHVGGTKRVVLLDEAHSMSTEAFNALLKTLEEPPPDTIFVLLTTEPNKIIKTVLSRLTNFDFVQIPVTEIENRLAFIAEQEGIEVEPGLLTLIANRAQGGLRDAVMTLDHMNRVGVKTVKEFRYITGEVDFAPDVLRFMALGDVAHTFAIVDSQLSRTGDPLAISTAIISCLRDVVVLHGGGDLHTDGTAVAARRALLSLVTPHRAVEALQVFWQLKTETRAADDPRALLDLAILMSSNKMVKDGLAASLQLTTPASAPKMTMSEIEAMVSGERV